MQTISNIDKGQAFDWGKTSDDYAKHRPGPPASFYDRLIALGVGLPGQRMLDLGTGTGVVIREFAKRGVIGAGIDIASEQIKMASSLATKEGLSIDFKVSPADSLPFPDRSFDIVIANQCWFYFDATKVLSEVKRVLSSANGFLVVSNFNISPRLDKLVRRTEDLVLKYNPKWTGADWDCEVPPIPVWAVEKLNLRGMFYYDEPIAFSRESWRGRIRACRGVAASLPPEAVQKFDAEHELMLQKAVGDRFSVIHRIDAHILQFKEL